MTLYDSTMAPRFAQLLDQRAAALRQLLAHDLEAAGAAGAPEVSDFKDAAGHEAQTLVEEAQSASAFLELGQVVAARRRLRDGSYGRCAACGDPIELGRLLALPATALCTACQASRERAGTAGPG